MRLVNGKMFERSRLTARSATINKCTGRILSLITIWALIDSIATFPFFVELALIAAGGDTSLPTLTVLRVFSLFRIMRAENYAQCFSSVHRVLWMNARIFLVALTLCLTLVLLTSVLLYYARPTPDWLEKNGNGNSSFSQFQSLPDTAYLSILMLTGQGQPEGPLPWFTKIIVALNAFISVGLFAVLASMLTWGFEQEAERLLRQDIIRRRRKERGFELKQNDKTLSEYSTDSSDTGGESISSDDMEDREYEEIIVDRDYDGDFGESEYLQVLEKDKENKTNGPNPNTAGSNPYNAGSNPYTAGGNQDTQDSKRLFAAIKRQDDLLEKIMSQHRRLHEQVQVIVAALPTQTSMS